MPEVDVGAHGVVVMVAAAYLPNTAGGPLRGVAAAARTRGRAAWWAGACVAPARSTLLSIGPGAWRHRGAKRPECACGAVSLRGDHRLPSARADRLPRRPAVTPPTWRSCPVAIGVSRGARPVPRETDRRGGDEPRTRRRLGATLPASPTHPEGHAAGPPPECPERPARVRPHRARSRPSRSTYHGAG